MAARKEKCPYCGGKHIWVVGNYLTVNSGRKIRVKCQTCARTWNRGEKPKQPRKVKGGK